MLTIILAVLAFQDAAPTMAGQAAPVGEGSAVVENPRWVRYPQINFNRTTRDRSGGVPDGRVVVECTATVAGRLEDCEVVSDSSVSNRLGPYALRAASDGRISPRRIDGRAVEMRVQYVVSIRPAE